MDLWEGKKYHQHSKLQTSLALDFLTILQKRFPSFPPNALFLDIGCGNGLVTSLLPNFFPDIDILGIDSSPDMVTFANKEFGREFLNFKVDRAEELKTIKDGQIDAIVSFSCLLWVHDLKSAFQAMQRVLKPGGWIGLQFPVEDYRASAIDEAYAQLLTEEPWKTHFGQKHKEVEWNSADFKMIHKWLLDAGFQLEKIEFAYWSYPFENKQALKDTLSAGFQHFKILPPDLHEAAINRVTDIYLEKSATRQPKDGSCIYECNGLQIIGRKT